MSGLDDERTGAVAASDVQGDPVAAPPTEVVPPVSEAEPPTELRPVTDEPAPEVVTDKRPTFESEPVVAPPPAPSPTDERPELLVGAAFAGGLAAALILKRLGR